MRNTKSVRCIFQFIFLPFAIILLSSLVYADGYYGESCDNGVCYEGRCNNYNYCEMCGWGGYSCCPGGTCPLSADEATCVGTFCQYLSSDPSDSDHCGFAGYEPCEWSPDFCRTGAVFIAANNMCIMCGSDFYQPCCPNASEVQECYFGECKGGICVPKDADNGDDGADGESHHQASTENGGGGDGCFITSIPTSLVR